MNEFTRLCPGPPNWRLDWDTVDRAFDWIRSLRGCPQDPVYHGEGDVWIHTRGVCRELAADPAWRALDEEARQVLFTAALLHDVAKPECTTREGARVSSRGHSHRGAIRARRILWEKGAAFDVREQICGMVLHHQRPFFWDEDPRPPFTAHRISQNCRCDWLAVLAAADMRGRSCPDRDRLLEAIRGFTALCRAEQCLDAPYRFDSGAARFRYFRHQDDAPDGGARFEVTLMSGLPGAGKDHWIRRYGAGRPVVTPGDEQTHIPVEARHAARDLLQAGEPFIWNASAVTRDQRRQLVDRFAAHGAAVRIVYVEAPAAALRARNARLLEALLPNWETPDPTEAHAVDWVLQED